MAAKKARRFQELLGHIWRGQHQQWMSGTEERQTPREHEQQQRVVWLAAIDDAAIGTAIWSTDAGSSVAGAASGVSVLRVTVTQSRPPAPAPTPAIHKAGRTDGSDAPMGIEVFEPSDTPVDQPIPALAAALN